MLNKFIKIVLIWVVALMATACATQQPYNYVAFKRSNPASIVILPPLNESLDVNATYAMLSQMTRPLAESGYYVLPVAVVDETFKQNGVTTAADAQSLPGDKLREIFGADAALYTTVIQYGSSYTVLSSVTTVSANATLVDLRTGDVIWSGSAIVSDNGGSNAGGGVIGMLVAGVMKQIINSTTDASYPMAGSTSHQLLAAGRKNGVLYGPRSPKYGSD